MALVKVFSRNGHCIIRGNKMLFTTEIFCKLYPQGSASTASIGEASSPARPLTNNLPDVLPTQQQKLKVNENFN